MKKTTKANKNAHTDNTKYGMGDHYGTGVKNPMGKVKEGVGYKPMDKKKMKTPPKSLA